MRNLRRIQALTEQDKVAMQRLRSCRKGKIGVRAFGYKYKSALITADADGPKHLDISLTRAKFENSRLIW